MQETLVRKGDDYQADHDPWSGFRKAAVHAGIDIVTAAEFFVEHKLSRLSTLRENGRPPANEGVEDTYLDLACYALLTYAMYLDTVSVESTPAILTDTVGSVRAGDISHTEDQARVGSDMTFRKQCARRGFHEPHWHEYFNEDRRWCPGVVQDTG